MKLPDLNGKKVCILGFGKEGKATFKAIEKYAPDTLVTIADKDPTEINTLIDANSPTNPTLLKNGFDAQSGETVWLRDLDRFDILIKSPGIPTHVVNESSVQSPESSDQTLTSPTDLFLHTIKDRGATVIGITGSKGKSTTSSLVYAILKQANKDVLLLGNIGEPAIAHLYDIKKGTIVVMEMSSYQLEHCTISPQVAVVTSFFPDHLDHHGGLEAYLAAKTHITRHQTENDTVFFNAEDEMAAHIAKHGHGRKILVDTEDCPVALSDTQLIGEHNKTNIALAWKACQSLGVQESSALTAIKAFTPLPHRLQSLGVHSGIEWVDDSISTTPESAIAALDALGDRVFALILGGQDRGVDFNPLKNRLDGSNVQLIVLLGESGKRIEEALKDLPLEMKKVKSMDEGIKEIVTSYELRETPEAKSPIALLSPASPSYDLYKNYEEKGEAFAKAVLQE